MTLADGRALVVEALGYEEAYLVRALPDPARLRPAARSTGTMLTLRLLGRDRGEAEIAGTRHQLRLRHSEILTLLCANPDGMTSEELSLGIYGDPAGAASIRVEISRLRKLLGDCIEPERYRLAWMVGSDVAHVCALLHRGEVREAAARYPGPLLPSSEAPGVIREREALEQWLRQSVMTADDQEALWTLAADRQRHDRPAGVAAAAPEPAVPRSAAQPRRDSGRASPRGHPESLPKPGAQPL